MKKTERTALTAAIFAAAIGTSAVTGGQAVAIDLAEEPVTAESDLESYATVYGPAPDFEYREPETEAISEEPTENMTMPEFQDVYGPPPTTEPETVESMTQALYGPIWDGGDANLDGKADVFDMPLIRKYVVSDNKFYSDPSVFNSDVNIDGKVNVADLVAFSQFLLGQRDYIGNGETKVKENKIKVIYEETTEPETEPSTSPFTDLPQPKYGPPYSGDPDWGLDPIEPFDPIEEPTYQAYYGPPSFFGLEDF
ncbi:MAG: dockerin type I repeat-containing protein [Ruminococcus sp.]|nr:dockerin type I repeat-containing protein [Ruminococcus sp.]